MGSNLRLEWNLPAACWNETKQNTKKNKKKNRENGAKVDILDYVDFYPIKSLIEIENENKNENVPPPNTTCTL